MQGFKVVGAQYIHMGDTTDVLRQHRIALDRDMAGVMPDSWEGHARIAIRESDEVPESIEEQAIEKALSLANEKDYAPEKVANKLISHIADKK